MTAPDYAALVERLEAEEKRACKLSDDAFENEHWDALDEHIAAFADMTHWFAEARAAITALARERDEAREQARSYVRYIDSHAEMAECDARVASARAAALEEAAKWHDVRANLTSNRSECSFHEEAAAAIRARAKPEPLP
jgi:uncharacterized coiled-coil DUF342 family protein